MKIILSIFFLLISTLANHSSVYAAEKCTSVPLSCISGGSFCKSEGFNCDNVLSLSAKECGEQNGCYENISCTGLVSGFCYLSKDEPPTPEECGYLGRKCCGDKTSWSCPHEGIPKKTDLGLSCTCKPSPTTSPATSPTPCVINDDEGISTAIGCIPTDTAPFVNYILARAVSIGGGIAFLLMLFGAFTLITSAGNPENVQKGKDILTSALTGLLFIIFAIFLLKFIGVDILQLPEFEETKITIPSRPTPKRR